MQLPTDVLKVARAKSDVARARARLGPQNGPGSQFALPKDQKMPGVLTFAGVAGFYPWQTQQDPTPRGIDKKQAWARHLPVLCTAAPGDTPWYLLLSDPPQWRHRAGVPTAPGWSFRAQGTSVPAPWGCRRPGRFRFKRSGRPEPRIAVVGRFLGMGRCTVDKNKKRQTTCPALIPKAFSLRALIRCDFDFHGF